jgi:hypothetical protein
VRLVIIGRVGMLSSQADFFDDGKASLIQKVKDAKELIKLYRKHYENLHESYEKLAAIIYDKATPEDIGNEYLFSDLEKAMARIKANPPEKLVNFEFEIQYLVSLQKDCDLLLHSYALAKQKHIATQRQKHEDTRILNETKCILLATICDFIGSKVKNKPIKNELDFFKNQLQGINYLNANANIDTYNEALKYIEPIISSGLSERKQKLVNDLITVLNTSESINVLQSKLKQMIDVIPQNTILFKTRVSSLKIKLQEAYASLQVVIDRYQPTTLPPLTM